jgi:hypothetical protein
MTTTASLNPDFRAFLLMDAPPAGCLCVPVTDEKSLPHLRPGEFAIVDPTDRAPYSGEVFLIEWNGGRREFVSVKERPARRLDAAPGDCAWWVGAPGQPWRAPSVKVSRERVMQEASMFGLVDGPLDRDHLQEKLVGRVVGILHAADGPMRLIA